MNAHFGNHDDFDLKATVIPLLFTICIMISIQFDHLYFGIVATMFVSILYAYQDGRE